MYKKVSLALLTSASSLYGAYAVESSLSLKSIVGAFISFIVTALVTLAITSAVAAFFFGVVRYLLGARDGDAAKIKQGNQFLLWGGISLFIMLSVWGIINYAQGRFGWDGDITIPNASLMLIGNQNQ